MNLLFSKFIFMLFALSLLYCEASYSQHHKNKKAKNTAVPKNTHSAKAVQPNTVNGETPFESSDSTELPCNLVAYAKTLIGTPYLYASVDPKKGFDCSGFITHVFSHFNLMVPRSSVDFTNYGKAISREESKPGDLILFTGTDSTIKVVGHMGIVVENISSDIQFIHSSSGTANGVVISRLTPYYLGRFVKITRVFKTLE